MNILELPTAMAHQERLVRRMTDDPTSFLEENNPASLLVLHRYLLQKLQIIVADIEDCLGDMHRYPSTSVCIKEIQGRLENASLCMMAMKRTERLIGHLFGPGVLAHR